MTARFTYSLPIEPPQGKPPEPGRPESMMDSALNIAVQILKLAEIPHQVEHRDHRQDPYRAATPLYGFYIRLQGPAANCQPLYYGWTYEPPLPWATPPGQEPLPPTWSPHHQCDTRPSRDFPKTHLTISMILTLWQERGLITGLQDSTGWTGSQDPRHLANVQQRTIASIAHTMKWYRDTLQSRAR